MEVNERELPLQLEPYLDQTLKWPSSGKHILAQYDEHTVVVYQAYNPRIAAQVVAQQNFHAEECAKSGFSMDRMTWIKTNFLWMMYRSGWASKPGQERILAIRLSRDGFEYILSKAVASSSGAKPSKSDEVRLQWDPDHDPHGEKVVDGRRAIQLGLRGPIIHKYSSEFIVRVDDITDFVVEQRSHVEARELDKLHTPLERVYVINNPQIAQQIRLSQLP